MPTHTGPDGTALHHDAVGAADRTGEIELVVLAGGPARHPDYLGDLAGLLSSRRALVPHLRGVGRSPAPDDDARGSAWAQAEDVEALRTASGARRLVLLAHSAATRLAVAYAVRFPEHVAGLVLVTPSVSWLLDTPSDSAEIVARRQGDPAFTAAVATLQGAPDTSDDDAFHAWQLAAAPAGYAHWGPREQAHAVVGRWSAPAVRPFLAHPPVDDVADRLRGLAAPVLVVAGAEDPFTGVAPARALADLVPGARFVVLEDCGHYPWVEQPELFRTVVDPFLDRVTGASSGAQLRATEGRRRPGARRG